MDIEKLRAKLVGKLIAISGACDCGGCPEPDIRYADKGVVTQIESDRYGGLMVHFMTRHGGRDASYIDESRTRIWIHPATEPLTISQLGGES